MSGFDTKQKKISPERYAAIIAYINTHYVEEALVLKAPLKPEAICSLPDVLEQAGETFSEMVLRKIDEEGLTDVQCYKKAHLDRKLFSKLRSSADYQPSKNTALALGLALELPLAEFTDLLEKAGYALSHASKRELIIEYFVAQKNYDFYEINQALDAFQQKVLPL